MFTLFERYINPTAVPENPEPPAGLVAFLWHFARQAKALFVALFIIELFVALTASAVALVVGLFIILFFSALTDIAVPWFMWRVVTMVCTIPPERFLAETWPWLVSMAL